MPQLRPGAVKININKLKKKGIVLAIIGLLFFHMNLNLFNSMKNLFGIFIGIAFILSIKLGRIICILLNLLRERGVFFYLFKSTFMPFNNVL